MFIKMCLLISLSFPAFAQQYLGNISNNPYMPKVNPYNPNYIGNPNSQYGSVYSDYSVNNPNAQHAPKLYDSQGNYHGRLSNNPYDPDSISNKWGRYGNPNSPESIYNQWGAGNPYNPDSPTNPNGYGMYIMSDE